MAWANVPVTALPWDRRWLHCECEEKRKERDCFQIAQAPKKRHFFISYLAYEKKKGKECWGRWWGNCWAQCKEVKLFSLGTCLKGFGWSLKSFSKKILNHLKKKEKKTHFKNDKKKLNAQVGDGVYFVIRKGESSLRYTQRLSSSDIKLQFLFTLFYVLVLNFSFLDIFKYKVFFFSFLNLHGLNLKEPETFYRVCRLVRKKANKIRLLDHRGVQDTGGVVLKRKKESIT